MVYVGVALCEYRARQPRYLERDQCSQRLPQGNQQQVRNNKGNLLRQVGHLVDSTSSCNSTDYWHTLIAHSGKATCKFVDLLVSPSCACQTRRCRLGDTTCPLDDMCAAASHPDQTRVRLGRVWTLPDPAQSENHADLSFVGSLVESQALVDDTMLEDAKIGKLQSQEIMGNFDRLCLWRW